jgi:hypothetical protein
MPIFIESFMSKMFFKLGLGPAGAGRHGSLGGCRVRQQDFARPCARHRWQTGADRRLGSDQRSAACHRPAIAQSGRLGRSDPSSQRPGQPQLSALSHPEEFTQQFGPTEADYQACFLCAKANGMTVTATHANRMLLEVSGKAADVQNAFNVTLHTYQHPTENRTFFSADYRTVRARRSARDLGCQRLGQLLASAYYPFAFQATNAPSPMPAAKARQSCGFRAIRQLHGQ